jgi:hypothetical protein
MDREEVLEALDTLRTLLPGSLGPAGEGVRRYLEVTLDGPATAPDVVSIASREYMDGDRYLVSPPYDLARALMGNESGEWISKSLRFEVARRGMNIVSTLQRRKLAHNVNFWIVWNVVVCECRRQVVRDRRKQREGREKSAHRVEPGLCER